MTKEALAQPEQEPVAVVTGVYGGRFTYAPFKSIVVLPVGAALYLQTPQRTWVGLTDDERNSLYEAHHNKYDLPNQGSPDGMDYERAIEAKLKEKNT